MLPNVGKFFPGEKIYEDLLRPSARELGDIFKNVVKTARFLLAPTDYLASQQDRFQKYLMRISEKVKCEDRVVAPPQVVGRSFESLRYIDDESILAEMFVNLLAASIDKNKIKFAHPAFPNILGNMSRDEAIILYSLNNKIYELDQYAHYNVHDNTFSASKTIKNLFPVNLLDFPENFYIYMNHLNSMGVAGVWQHGNQVPDIKNNVQVGVTIHNVIRLTDFGEMLACACISDGIERFINNDAK